MTLNIFPFSNLNDFDFSQLLDNYHYYPLDVIENMTFDQFQSYNNRTPITNDLNPMMKELNCKYYSCSNFSSFDCSSILSMLCYNISSIPRHWDEFCDQCLSVLNVRFDILGFCETRLNDNICMLYRLNRYNAYFNNRDTGGGGLALYLHNNFQGTVIKNISLKLHHIESLFLRVKGKLNFIIGLLYRPPNSNPTEFLHSLHEILQALSNENLPCYVMGDLNINLLKRDNNMHDLLNLFYSHLFFPVVNKPTRVTKYSASLIDHIWTSESGNYLYSGIFYTSISDHFPIFSLFTIKNVTKSELKRTITKRMINDDFINNFKVDLSNYRWDLNTSNSVSDIFEIFLVTFLEIYDKNFPNKTYVIKDKYIGKPYITQGIIKSIKERNRLQRLYSKWPLTYENTFKRYRNKLTSVIRAAKADYYKTTLNINKGNSRKFWEIVNNIMGKDKQIELPYSIAYEGSNIYKKEDIAEAFNDHFCNIATSLLSSHNVQHSFKDFMPHPVPYSFYLKPTYEDEIINIVRSLKQTSPGHDMVHIKVIKRCIEEISPILVFIINKSFSVGEFPRQLQIAKVIPVYKKGNRCIPHNYRPISILSAFSKIFEKVMSIRLFQYLTEKSLLSTNQFGFRPNYSCELAIQKLCQSIYNAMDLKKFHLTVFCDFAKAFDTIPHDILLDKLHIYGIRGPAHKWFKSYLNHRRQYTMYYDQPSSVKNLCYGVPQGSILGPILFLIFINDLPRSSDKLRFLLFADDTTIFTEDYNLDNLSKTVNTELRKVYKWIQCNKLTLNIQKTHYMLSCSLMTETPSIQIKVNEIKLTQVDEAKFLGITIDSKLSFKPQIEEIKSKLSRMIGVFHKIRDQLDVECLLKIYSTLVYPHLLYCSAIWGGGYSTHLDSLVVLQKKLLRTMFNFHYYQHTGPLFKDHKILKVKDIIDIQTCILVYYSTHSCPLNLGFVPIVHQTQTRSGNDLRIPLYRTSHAQQCVLFRGARLWNNLSHDIRDSPSKFRFKSKLKYCLLEKY